jgi:Tfp pilus assembly protein FimV
MDYVLMRACPKGASMASRLLRRLVATFTALLLVVSAATTAQAEPREVAALRQQVTELKQVVQRLDERVGQLEGQLSPASASSARTAPSVDAPTPPSVSAAAQPEVPTPQPPQPTVQRDPVRDHWHQISRGMTTQVVEGLLGRPHRTMTVNTQTVWYYSYPDVGGGSVVFAQDGSVVDWQTPPFNTWW